MPTTDTSDLHIRSLIAELIGSAPQAPSLPELEWRDPRRSRPRRLRLRRPGRRRQRPALLGAGLVLLLTSVLVFVTAVGERQPAAAAQLRTIAAHAADQPVLRLGRDQWLVTTQVYVTSLVVTSARSLPGSRARATVTVTDTQWSNDVGQACISSSSSPARFASNADKTAWLSTGLSDDPTEQPVASCPLFVSADETNGFAAGIGAVDVSSLPRSPSALARELRRATTGVQGLDRSQRGSDPGFDQAVALLIGPLTGTTKSFDAAVYRALALRPGIHQLGPMTTQSGATGLGFSAGSGPERPIIIVDPGTGALLEARNIRTRTALYDLAGLGRSFGSSGSVVVSDAVGADFGKVRWIDPVGSPTVVATDAIPSDLKPPPPPTALITATARRGVGAAPLSALQERLETLFGTPGDGSGYNPAPGGGILSFTLSGSRKQAEECADALRRSALIASVAVRFGQ
jgi:hypothetical protein